MTDRERVGFIGNASSLLDAGALRGDDFLRLLAPFARDSDPEVVDGGAHVPRQGEAGVRHRRARSAVRDLRPRDPRPALRAVRHGAPRGRAGGGVAACARSSCCWLGRDGNDPAALEPTRPRSRARTWPIPPRADPVDGRRRAAARWPLHGDRALFDEYRRRAESATVPAERQRYLGRARLLPRSRPRGRGVPVRAAQGSCAAGSLHDPVRRGQLGRAGGAAVPLLRRELRRREREDAARCSSPSCPASPPAARRSARRRRGPSSPTRSGRSRARTRRWRRSRRRSDCVTLRAREGAAVARIGEQVISRA